MLHLIIRSIAICYPKVVLHLLLLLEGWTSSSRRKSTIASATRSFAASWKRPENSHFSNAWKSIWARFFCNVKCFLSSLKFFLLLPLRNILNPIVACHSDPTIKAFTIKMTSVSKSRSSLCVSLIYLNNFCVFHVEKKIYKQSDIFLGNQIVLCETPRDFPEVYW